MTLTMALSPRPAALSPLFRQGGCLQRRRIAPAVRLGVSRASGEDPQRSFADFLGSGDGKVRGHVAAAWDMRQRARGIAIANLHPLQHPRDRCGPPCAYWRCVRVGPLGRQPLLLWRPPARPRPLAPCPVGLQAAPAQGGRRGTSGPSGAFPTPAGPRVPHGLRAAGSRRR